MPAIEATVTSQKQRIPVFVLSLARAHERRSAICRHLDDLLIEYQLIDAVDGAALDPADVKRMLAPGVRMHPGAIGCYLSHLAAYTKIRDADEPLALVLEDDARLHPGIAALLSEGCTCSHWDYCFLDCDDHNESGPVFYDVDSAVVLGGGFRVYELSAGPHTLHAYLISREAAANRLKHAFPIEQPIDVYRQLPYQIRFYSILSPKGAWVSEHSLESFTSGKKARVEDMSFAFFRRWQLFFDLRDFLTLRGLRKRFLARSFQAQGKLAPGKRWRILPTGREVVVGRSGVRRRFHEGSLIR